MHNMLLDRLPVSVEVDGQTYAVNWQFEYMIAFELAMQGEDNFSVEDALTLFFYAKEHPVIPKNAEAAMQELLKFYAGEKPGNPKQQKARSRQSEALYSFKYDDELIYAAFLQAYGVDLADANDLHWFKFRAMLHALPEDCKFTEIVGYRGVDLTKIKDTAMRARCKEMRDFYALPLPQIEQEKLDAVRAALMGCGDIRLLLEE